MVLNSCSVNHNTEMIVVYSTIVHIKVLVCQVNLGFTIRKVLRFECITFFLKEKKPHKGLSLRLTKGSQRRTLLLCDQKDRWFCYYNIQT